MMTTMTLILAEFLLARIGEDEARAQRLEVHFEWCRSLSGTPWGALGPLPPNCDCGYPARVLAECEAKRRIVERCERAIVEQGIYSEDGQSELAQDALSLLALPYADHSDYRPEWSSS